MKFLKFLKVWNKVANVCSLSESDIDLLAFMCRLCEPKITKDGFLTRHYAYYVPQDEEDLEIAKDIFAANGIPVREHLSGILYGMAKQKVLRVDYGDVANKDKLKQEMKRIEKRCGVLMYKEENKKKIEDLFYKVQELKQTKKLNQTQR